VFDRVLVANRGEIAVRVLRTVRALGASGIAVYSDADVDALHVHAADDAVRLGPAPAAESYLRVDALVDAARRTGAQALHPGYGFLSENAELAEACASAGIAFVGPSAAVIATMGDKVLAKELVAGAGVAVVPGSEGHDLDDDALAAAAERIGYPVLVKPAAGGGGKGMRRVDDPAALADHLRGARREALAAFGDDGLLVERFVDAPRHIEVQVLGDHHGNVVHLGERECSLQRRHQKIVEECPSPLLDAPTRAAMGAAAVAVARACGYTSAGTVEFIVTGTRPHEFFFLEMNTRLQVEHPVTEMVYGLDLVEAQLRVAAGEALPFGQGDLRPTGHAVEARVYAEDPARDFLPTGGRVVGLAEAADRPGVRVDSSLRVGLTVGPDYDPLLAKVIAHAHDRAGALLRLDGALAATAVLGVTTNTGFLRALLADPDVAAGRLDTDLVARRLDDLVADGPPDAVVLAAALDRFHDPSPAAGPWDTRTGWALGGHRPLDVTVHVDGGAPTRVTARRDGREWIVAVDGAAERTVGVAVEGDRTTVTLDGRTTTLLTATSTDGARWWGVDGSAWWTRVDEPAAAHDDDRTGAHRGPVVSPMPGALTTIDVAEGDVVVAGQALAAVEAMKMEFTLRAPCDGTVAAIHARVGERVGLGQPVVTVDPRPEPAAGNT
jgi:acetyl-CoA/propionyl-CoA carboxylase biotin carboxyl carrier protein